MKFGNLKSVAHNIADSFASGMGFMIGIYATDVFAEASASPEGYILVDFVAGTSSGAQISPSLSKAISLYSETLNDLCQRQAMRRMRFAN
ncbi:MAG: hypothetical protein NVV72_00475 [Asticcacaulis sp.]|nr:hypothetical protein [Asticcacaulis sp.]